MSQTLIITLTHQRLLDGCGLRTLDDVFAWSRGDRLDKSGLEGWRQRWRIELPEGERAHRLYLKRFDHPPAKRQWERIRAGHWRTGTAGIEWRNARDLATVGIAAAEAVAFGEQMNGWIEQRSFIMLREVAGESLERWLPRELPPLREDPDRERRRRRLEALAAFVAKFHAAGFVHRDLYLSHIFIDPAAEPDNAFALIDLQRVFRPRFRRLRWVVKDLAALHFSTPAGRVGRLERLRFLCRYARACGQRDRVRALLGRIAQKARWMRRRHEGRES